MTFDHTHRKDLIKIIEPQNNNSLIIKTVNVKTDIIKPESDTFYHVIWMLVNILQELFDIWVSTTVQIRVIYVHDNIFEIIFFLFPL